MNRSIALPTDRAAAQARVERVRGSLVKAVSGVVFWSEGATGGTAGPAGSTVDGLRRLLRGKPDSNAVGDLLLCNQLLREVRRSSRDAELNPGAFEMQRHPPARLVEQLELPNPYFEGGDTLTANTVLAKEGPLPKNLTGGVWELRAPRTMGEHCDHNLGIVPSMRHPVTALKPNHAADAVVVRYCSVGLLDALAVADQLGRLFGDLSVESSLRLLCVASDERIIGNDVRTAALLAGTVLVPVNSNMLGRDFDFGIFGQWHRWCQIPRPLLELAALQAMALLGEWHLRDWGTLPVAQMVINRMKGPPEQQVQHLVEAVRHTGPWQGGVGVNAYAPPALDNLIIGVETWFAQPDIKRPAYVDTYLAGAREVLQAKTPRSRRAKAA